MKKILILIALIFFTGCGSSSSNTVVDTNESNITETNSTEENITGVVQKADSLLYQQWAIYKDDTFYAQNGIDADANIHMQSIFNTYTGKGIKVAVIDNGFDIIHPEIKGHIYKTIAVDQNGNISSNVSHTLPTDYHGTSVSGIIAATDDGSGVRGVAPEVELILIKMPEYADDASTIELFKQAVDNGADVINCSWGSGDVSDAVKDYIEEISTTGRGGKGVTVVFASGNDSALMQNDESAIPTVIGVGATDKDNLRTEYSNYGKDLDIAAPGGYSLGITTIDPLGTEGASSDGYIRYNELNNGKDVSFIGTSAAAPIVTGAVALALEKDPSLTRVQIQNLLAKSNDIIGQNTPYIDDMITSSSTTPIIYGVLGSNQNSDIKVRLISHSTNNIYGPYSIDVSGDNTWSSSVTDQLDEGNYTIEVIPSDGSFVWSTDTDFEINTSKQSVVDKEIKKSDFYGYGKLDVAKLLGNINGN